MGSTINARLTGACTGERDEATCTSTRCCCCARSGRSACFRGRPSEWWLPPSDRRQGEDWGCRGGSRLPGPGRRSGGRPVGPAVRCGSLETHRPFRARTSRCPTLPRLTTRRRLPIHVGHVRCRSAGKRGRRPVGAGRGGVRISASCLLGSAGPDAANLEPARVASSRKCTPAAASPQPCRLSLVSHAEQPRT